MIKFNDRKVTLQEAVNLLIVCHLQFGSSEVSERTPNLLAMRTSHRNGNTYDMFEGDTGELTSLTRLAEVLSSKLVPKPSYLDKLTRDEMQQIFYRNADGKAKAKSALAVICRSQLDNDVIQKFSLNDLCTAYAFFVEANRSEQSYIFDSVLHTMCETQEA